MDLKEYEEVKLTEQDLEEFKFLVNDYYGKKRLAEDELYAARIAFKKGDITKEKLEEYKQKSLLMNTEFSKIVSSKFFKQNLKNAKELKKNKSIDPKIIENEIAFATRLFQETKNVIKEKGWGAQLSKINNTAIEVKNLNFKYAPDFPYALKDVSFEIKEGEYVTIIGHNGSGKSTLSKVLIGVQTPESGSIKMFGNPITKTNIDQIRRFLGIVFQNPDNQFIGSTVEADIAFGLENKRVDPKEMKDIIIESATKVGMQDFLQKEPLNLSGGQKQRVAIASTLALNPDILIFDEATSMLDPKGKREIKEIMLNLRKNSGKTIISITHDMDEILNADKVIVMNRGELIRMGKPLDILKDKNFLRSIHLDIPFIAKVEEQLQELGIDVKGSKNMDELVKKIWKK